MLDRGTGSSLSAASCYSVTVPAGYRQSEGTVVNRMIDTIFEWSVGPVTGRVPVNASELIRYRVRGHVELPSVWMSTDNGLPQRCVL